MVHDLYSYTNYISNILTINDTTSKAANLTVNLV